MHVASWSSLPKLSTKSPAVFRSNNICLYTFVVNTCVKILTCIYITEYLTLYKCLGTCFSLKKSFRVLWKRWLVSWAVYIYCKWAKSAKNLPVCDLAKIVLYQTMQYRFCEDHDCTWTTVAEDIMGAILMKGEIYIASATCMHQIFAARKFPLIYLQCGAQYLFANSADNY